MTLEEFSNCVLLQDGGKNLTATSDTNWQGLYVSCVVGNNNFLWEFKIIQWSQVDHLGSQGHHQSGHYNLSANNEIKILLGRILIP